MKNSWYILSVYHEDQLTGTGRVVSDRIIVGYFAGLVVHPDYRNRGLGKDILQKLIVKCKQSYLVIQLLATDSSIPFYQRLGFQSFVSGLIYVER